MWGKMFFKTSGPKIKVEFKDSLFFTNRIIHKNCGKTARKMPMGGSGSRHPKNY